MKTYISGVNLIDRINIGFLLCCISFVLFFPVKKKLWYDETVSILCSKGVYFAGDGPFDSTSHISSLALARYNTVKGVYNSTLTDNSNGILYNEILHCSTLFSGNDVDEYMWPSKLAAIGLLIAFYVLSHKLMGSSVYCSLAVLLLTCDSTFWIMSHEIRAYAMAMLFVVMGAIYSINYTRLYRAADLIIASFTIICAMLCHYLVILVIPVFILYVAIVRINTRWTVSHILGISIPAIFLLLYLFSAKKGFVFMSTQASRLTSDTAREKFSVANTLWQGLRFMAINFKVEFPLFLGNHAVKILSVSIILMFYVVAYKKANKKEIRQTLHFLFAAGNLSVVTLTAASLLLHTNTPVYFRYYSFCIPFCILFTVYALYVISSSGRIAFWSKFALIALVVMPSIIFFATKMPSRNKLRYNHPIIATYLKQSQVHELVVPSYEDALLVNCFLPEKSMVNYLVDTVAGEFRITVNGKVKRANVIKTENQQH